MLQTYCPDPQVGRAGENDKVRTATSMCLGSYDKCLIESSNSIRIVYVPVKKCLVRKAP